MTTHTSTYLDIIVQLPALGETAVGVASDASDV
jgi:hypothetical protein